MNPMDAIELPCAICGKGVDECTCEECSICGTTGCLEHIESHKIASIVELLEYQLLELKKEAKKREVVTAPCPNCGNSTIITIFQDYPTECCGYEFWRNEWVNYSGV